MAPTDYSLADVAALTGTPVRTIRYYVAQGLLPAPGRTGPSVRYDEAFVARLRAIRRLQERHLPLADIRRALDGLADASVIAAVEPPEERPSDSAAAYVRRLLGVAEESVSYEVAAPAPAAVAPPAPSGTIPPTAAFAPPARASAGIGTPDASRSRHTADEPGLAAVGRFVPPDPGSPPSPTVPSSPAGLPVGRADPLVAWERPATDQRSHWERIPITPDVEIHVRRPLGRLSARRADRLIQAARDIFETGA